MLLSFIRGQDKDVRNGYRTFPVGLKKKQSSAKITGPFNGKAKLLAKDLSIAMNCQKSIVMTYRIK